jgi:hypothetical protein
LYYINTVLSNLNFGNIYLFIHFYKINRNGIHSKKYHELCSFQLYIVINQLILLEPQYKTLVGLHHQTYTKEKPEIQPILYVEKIIIRLAKIYLDT